MIWNFVVMSITFYSCVVVPVIVAFEQDGFGDKNLLEKIINSTVDGLFFIDIIINFISAYEI